MKIKSHSESHIVELEDGSRWQIFPGDLDLTLNWKPETDLTVVPSDDEISSHMLVNGSGKVHAWALASSCLARQSAGRYGPLEGERRRPIDHPRDPGRAARLRIVFVGTSEKSLPG